MSRLLGIFLGTLVAGAIIFVFQVAVITAAIVVGIKMASYLL